MRSLPSLVLLVTIALPLNYTKNSNKLWGKIIFTGSSLNVLKIFSFRLEKASSHHLVFYSNSHSD